MGDCVVGLEGHGAGVVLGEGDVIGGVVVAGGDSDGEGEA